MNAPAPAAMLSDRRPRGSWTCSGRAMNGWVSLLGTLSKAGKGGGGGRDFSDFSSPNRPYLVLITGFEAPLPPEGCL